MSVEHHDDVLSSIQRTDKEPEKVNLDELEWSACRKQLHLSV